MLLGSYNEPHLPRSIINSKYIIVASLLGFIFTFVATMTFIAVPAISDYFSISYLHASLLVTIYVAIETVFFVPFTIIFEKIGLRLSNYLLTSLSSRNSRYFGCIVRRR